LARQSHLGAKRGGETDRHIHTALGNWLAAHLVESKAWAMYRERLKQFASLIGDREPIVLKRRLPGMGRAMRYIITIADDDRRLLQNLCQKLSATDIACDVMRNKFGPG
jgi:hypothetical protein